LHLILHISLLTSELRDLSPDAFFVDQLSAGLPLLKALSRAPIFFYCHFPDLLLAQGRARLWKRLYRIPFDALEQWSMAYADAIAVNSSFTKSIVSHTWPRLARHKTLHVVHPCINTTTPSPPPDPLPWVGSGPQKNTHILLSINRFERKKNIALALHAFALLPPARRAHAKLLLAGGYDPRIPENVSYHAELVTLAESLGLKTATAKTLPSALTTSQETQVLFLLSVPNMLKEILLRSARLLVYTPANEHFGIVPLEAMLRGVPVLAADSGGPKETVVEGVTGWLRDPEEPGKWSAVMDAVLNEMGEAELQAMGRAGVERVESQFAEGQMAERLEGILGGMESQRVVLLLPIVLLLPVVLAGVVALVSGAVVGEGQ
jgi:alpha-1,3/alpha-1,6-mannosyltransferase